MVIFEDLREYINYLEERNLLKKIYGADWNLEIGAITELVAFSKNPRPLLFDKIKGYPDGFRVATNLYITHNLQAIALGLKEGNNKISTVIELKEKLKSIKPIKPREVSDGPIKENVLEGDQVDLLKFPAPKWHELDGGRYIGTGDCVITKDPEEGWVNVGTYRAQILSKNTLGILIQLTRNGWSIINKYWDKNKDAPIVITVGQDPILFHAAGTHLPWGYSELDYAGGFRGKPIDVIIDDDTGLPVPATAEIALIGYLKKDELEMEGPFGECDGNYAAASKKPVVRVKKIWFRNEPIIQGGPTMRGYSAMVHSLGAELMTSANVWAQIENNVPNIQGVYSHFQGCITASPFLVISIKQMYPGHSMQAALAAISSPANVTDSKIVVVVDDDVDPSNINDVMWAIWTRCDFTKDLVTLKGMPVLNFLPIIDVDERKKEEKDITSTSLIIDATKKPFGKRDKYPPRNIISDNYSKIILDKWHEVLKEFI
jgi:4-hydroxy-3-polyprenylbenzoate decarboxylase